MLHCSHQAQWFTQGKATFSNSVLFHNAADSKLVFVKNNWSPSSLLMTYCRRICFCTRSLAIRGADMYCWCRVNTGQDAT